MQIEEKLEKIEAQLEAMSTLQGQFYGAQYAGEASDEIDLRELWDALWNCKWLIMAVTFVFAVASVLYALSLPNIYKSEALLAPAEESSGGGLASMGGQFGGLASLAGVNLGGGAADKTTLALSVLKSREFIFYFIEKHSLLVPLMAAKGWDREKDELIIDSDAYNPTTGVWVRDVSPPNKPKPSMQKAYNEFTQRLSVSQDKESSYISLGFESYSPSASKQWVDWLVEDINLKLKERDVAEAERSIKYLKAQLEKTSVTDMQSIFYELIEEQTKTIMFAEVRDEYVFKTIDAAVVPELKSKPKRALICIFGIMLGGFLAAVTVLVRYFLFSVEVTSTLNSKL